MSSKKIISRIAPTPSGYLHLGNITNFYNTWKYVRENNGILWLRIDDCDGTRERPEYVKDIFDCLNYLGIDWDKGPKDAEDFYQNYSQQDRMHHYRSYLNKIDNSFVCECSRKDISQASKDGRYPGTCYDKDLRLKKNKTCLRIKTHSDISMGDFVIWRKDDLASYQLVSLIDDIDTGCNFILRGEDLRQSTQAQLYLDQILGTTLHRAQIIHHPLLTDSNGQKLSKGLGSYSIKQMIEQGYSRQQILSKVQLFNNLSEKQAWTN
jgi:glutamyl/glutaminyl-tRNA synthetase